MSVNFYTVKLYGAMTAMVREVISREGRRSRYGALLQWNKGTWTDERHCKHQHRSLNAAKRCASSLQWEDVK